MPEIPDKIYNKIGRQEGFKNEADIYDFAFTDEIEKELDKEEIKIEVHASSPLNPETEKAIKKIQQVMEEIIPEFKKRFIENLSYFHALPEKSQQKFLKYFQSHPDRLLPKIKIFDSNHSVSTLRNCDFPHERIKENNALVLIRFPNVLEKFFWKEQEQSGRGIRWSDIYKDLLNFFWDNLRACLHKHQLFIDRINDFGEHDSRKYYYLFEAGTGPIKDARFIYNNAEEYWYDENDDFDE